MHLITPLLLLVSVALPVLGQSNDNPPCVERCIEENLSNSFCDGDETGAALDECTCTTLAQAPMIPCINQCPDEERAIYKGRLPEVCADDIIPGVTAVREGEEETEEGEPEEEEEPSATPTAEAEPAATTGAAVRGVDLPAMLAVGGGLVAMLAF